MNSITKEEFVEIWKKISNDKRIRPTITEFKSYSGTILRNKEKGWLYPEHYIIYNFIRELPLNRGFKEDTEGFKNALKFLKTGDLNYSTFIFKPFEGLISLDNLKLLLLKIQSELNLY